MDDTADLSFEEIAFVGVPDWPAPGERVSGVIDLVPADTSSLIRSAAARPRP